MKYSFTALAMLAMAGVALRGVASEDIMVPRGAVVGFKDGPAAAASSPNHQSLADVLRKRVDAAVVSPDTVDTKHMPAKRGKSSDKGNGNGSGSESESESSPKGRSGKVNSPQGNSNEDDCESMDPSGNTSGDNVADPQNRVGDVSGNNNGGVSDSECEEDDNTTSSNSNSNSNSNSSSNNNNGSGNVSDPECEDTDTESTNVNTGNNNTGSNTGNTSDTEICDDTDDETTPVLPPISTGKPGSGRPGKNRGSGSGNDSDGGSYSDGYDDDDGDSYGDSDSDSDSEGCCGCQCPGGFPMPYYQQYPYVGGYYGYNMGSYGGMGGMMGGMGMNMNMGTNQGMGQGGMYPNQGGMYPNQGQSVIINQDKDNGMSPEMMMWWTWMMSQQNQGQKQPTPTVPAQPQVGWWNQWGQGGQGGQGNQVVANPNPLDLGVNPPAIRTETIHTAEYATITVTKTAAPASVAPNFANYIVAQGGSFNNAVQFADSEQHSSSTSVAPLPSPGAVNPVAGGPIPGILNAAAFPAGPTPTPTPTDPVGGPNAGNQPVGKVFHFN
ncbi:hypothetical protein H4R18_001981 [Coemansia javaensis]|uniref:Uncharacterized protein n=1 Tax=Coemansia javaensis TaxID=2761396 RepID=A0A9W8HC69_9FUNG|nr:hypothetical protein H4R18_001981 [Coemansia javaensis]